MAQHDAAEKLIASLVGDFRQKLVPIGKVDVMSALGDRVLEYYREAPAGADRDDAAAILRRAEAIATLAGAYEVRLQRGAAERAYKDAIALCVRAHEVQPGDVESEKWRARYLFRLTFIYLGVNRYREAIAAVDESLAVLETLSMATTNSDELAALTSRRALAFAMKGQTLDRAEDLDGARAALTSGIATITEFRTPPKGDLEWIRNLGWGYLYRALLFRQGDLTSSLADAEESLRLRNAMLAKTPDHAYNVGEVAWSKATIGQIFTRMGKDDLALASLLQARNAITDLSRRDSEQTEWQDSIAEESRFVCAAEQNLGHYARALKACRAALDGYELVNGRHRDSSDVLTNVDEIADAYALSGEARRATGDPSGALAELESAILNLRGDFPLFDEAPLRLGLAEAKLALGRAEEALSDARLAVEETSARAEKRRGDVIAADLLQSATLVLGDCEQAGRDVDSARKRFQAAHDACAPLMARAPLDASIALHCAEADSKLATLVDAASARALRDRARGLVDSVPEPRRRPLGRQKWLRDLE